MDEKGRESPHTGRNEERVWKCFFTTIGAQTSVRMARPAAKTKHAGRPSRKSDAGGWPTHGFSQSSGIHDVWNFWIIYPFIAWVLILATRAWSANGNKPISEGEIKRVIERRAEAR